MKKKRIYNVVKIFVLCILILNLTGCTKYLKNDDGSIVKNEQTGQNLPSNILCKPTDSSTINYYSEYNKNAKKSKKIDISSLEKCSNMKLIGNSYEGLWSTFFVKPLAIFIIKLGELVNSYGLGLILATLIIRGIVWPMTKKTAAQSENLKLAKPELDRLEKKYAKATTQDEMMKKTTEMMMIYKKYNINPMSGCLFSFIQIPLFFAFYEAISRIPVIFEETFFGFQLGTSPLIAVSKGNYHYLIFIVLIAAATYFSFKLNSGAAMNSEQEKQMKTMSNFMVIFMTFTAFSISSGIAIYWVTSNVFTIFQNLMVKRRKKSVAK